MAEVVSSQGAKCERIVFGKNDTDFLLITLDNGNRYLVDGRVSSDQEGVSYYEPENIESALRDLESTIKFTDESGLADAEVFTSGYDEHYYMSANIYGVESRNDLYGTIYADHDADSGKWIVTMFTSFGGYKLDDSKFDALIGKEMSAEELGDRLREIR
jgi:hypothetical protein